MKKLILTAAFISTSTMGFAQQNNVFGDSPFQIQKHKTERVEATNTTTLNNSPAAYATAAALPKPTCSVKGKYPQNLEEAMRMAEENGVNNQTNQNYLCAMEWVRYFQSIQDQNTVPVDGIAFPLMASALALMVAFRKRIAGTLS